MLSKLAVVALVVLATSLLVGPVAAQEAGRSGQTPTPTCYESSPGSLIWEIDDGGVYDGAAAERIPQGTRTLNTNPHAARGLQQAHEPCDTPV